VSVKPTPIRTPRNKFISQSENSCYGAGYKNISGKTSRFMPRQIKTSATAERRMGAGTLALGTIVYTLDGALPVEFLNAGDRIVTRAGSRVLRGISGDSERGFALSFDAPQVVYADGMQVAMA